MTGQPKTEDLLRELTPQVLGVLMRRYAGLDSCEDAVQEALLDAAAQWPSTGPPDNPRAWLLTVATRRLADILRSESARRRREDAVYLATPPAVLAGAEELADALARHHRFHAVRGHLLEMSGAAAAAAAAYDLAARYATNAAEQRYLSRQSRRVRGG
jgi:predicted RNA polymerase sigma factor